MTDSIRSGVIADRGVSEVVSFLLLFAVLIGISITGAVFGIESLEHAGDGDDTQAAVSAMKSVRGDLHDLSSGAVYRSTEIRLNEGSVRYGEPITLTITATVGDETVFVSTTSPEPLVFDIGSVAVVYTDGAIILDQSDGGVVKAGPTFRIDPEQTILPLVNTSFGAGPAGMGGSGIGYVVGYRIDDIAHRLEPTDAEGNPVEMVVSVSIETPRAEPWRRSFESDPRFSTVLVDANGETVTATFVTKRLYVKVTAVEVRLSV